LIDLEIIKKAHERIRNVVVETPFSYAPRLSEQCGCEIYLKKENLQVTGAFKIRGAYNKIASLNDRERGCGVIAASAGNHAQGVAMAAQMFGIHALIVMPESTPLTKINGVRYYGADVILSGSNYDEAYAYACEYGQKEGMVFVHPFADEAVMAGQGTLALEMLGSMSDLDAIVIPVGGGGLISGMASCIKQISPDIEIIGVGALGAPAMRESFEAKKAIDSLSVRTIADGIAVRDTSPLTLSHILESVDRMISVDDEEIANAILFLLERQKLVVEGAGAAGVAALLHHKLPHLQGKKVGIVLSGGNVDVTLLSIIIEKGLIKSGRKMKLTVTLIDKPGALMQLTRMLQELNANIVHIEYDRTSTSLAYGDANVTIHLETKGEEHQAQIRSLLHEHHYLSSEEN
jgi:threonine dehydratase